MLTNLLVILLRSFVSLLDLKSTKITASPAASTLAEVFNHWEKEMS